MNQNLFRSNDFQRSVFLIMNKIKFGPAGNSESFYEQGHRNSVEMPKWLHDMGLEAYEYSVTRGIRLKESTAGEIGEQAAKWGIAMSLHAPYYINLASREEEGRKKTVRYLYRSMEAADWFGAKRVVFHPGSAGKGDREPAMKDAKKLLLRAMEECSEFIAKGIHLCPETMGKKNQLGSLEEILDLCQLDESLIPTVDFGHLHARSQGGIRTSKDYENILDSISGALDDRRGRAFHVHFSRIEYTAAGEKRHRTYQETEYGPDFEPLAELLLQKNLEPVIICESRKTMAEDAVRLQKILQEKFSLFNGARL
jgi:deoxyribonuclease-4